MHVFPHIDTLFDRDQRTHQVIVTTIRRPEFISVNNWVITEKIDGTNTRVQLTKEGKVNYSGRTDRSSLPKDIQEMLCRTFPVEKMTQLWHEGKPPTEFVLFGESYGAKIQNGGLYRSDVGFRLFDVAIIGDDGRVWWQEWSTIIDAAHKLGIALVPMLENKPTSELVRMVQDGFYSTVATEDSEQAKLAEGIVARSNPILFNRKGERVIWKLKTRDFHSAPKNDKHSHDGGGCKLIREETIHERDITQR